MPLIRSVPGWLSIRFSTENDPLGAFVRAEPRKATLPLSLIRTFQRTPFLFWSTSNSTSRRPSSGLTLIVAVLEPLHLPAFLTSASLAPAAAGTASATVASAVVAMIGPLIA